MARYSVTAYDVPTGAVVDTFVSLMGIKAADTAGHIARLCSISVGGGGQAAQDLQCSLRLARTDNTADGTGTAVVPTKHDPNSPASNLTAKETYTVEPTALESTYLWEDGFNARGTIIKEWAAGKGPLWGKNQTLVLQATPGDTTAITLDITMEYEEGV